MYKFNIYNVIYDFQSFIKSNVKKITACSIISIAAIILGIRGAFSVDDAASYLFVHPTDVFLIIINKKSVFGYFFSHLITDILLIALITLASVHFLTSFFCYIIIFFRSYLFALHIALYIILFKLSILPYILICLIPCFLLNVFLLTIITAIAVNRAKEAHYYGTNCENNFIGFAKKMILPCIISAILAIICSVLTYFFTLGIIF